MTAAAAEMMAHIICVADHVLIECMLVVFTMSILHASPVHDGPIIGSRIRIVVLGGWSAYVFM